MCRIAGIVGGEGHYDANLQAVRRMCDSLKHGGPDDEGIYTSEHKKVILGNRRLSLLDLSSAGKMPLVYQSRYIITYNGELYNHLDLKSTLTDLGYEFHTNTDTEVLAAAFAQWREGAFVKLSGMFAFAIWDKFEDELFLVRDSVGIKPIYYSIANEQLFFASEVRAFNETGLHHQSNEKWPVYFMAYGHLPEPITTHENVFPLPKGFFLKYSVSTGKSSFQSYRHFSFNAKVTDKKDSLQYIRELMSASVQKQLLADAPVGVFLSGGLDSGIIASLAKKINKDVHSLSIYFQEEAFSEKKYQDQLSERLHIISHQLLLEESVFHQSMSEILDSMDLPSCDGINTWFISKYAKDNGFKAVLSGLGGDELYGGYPSFKRMGISRMISQFPSLSRNIFKTSSDKKLNRLSYLNMSGVKGLYLFLRGHFSPHEIAKQLDAKETEIWNILSEAPVYLEAEDSLGNKNLASWIEFNLYMQNQLLRDSDVMSMKHGVELRVPFLDEKHIQFCMSIPEEVKFPKGFTKQLLINAFKDDLPEMIWNRPKMGFSFPFAQWLKNNPMVQSFGHKQNNGIQKNYRRFMQGTLHWSQLMTLLILSKRNMA